MLVLLHKDNLPPMSWRLAVITEVQMDSENQNQFWTIQVNDS